MQSETAKLIYPQRSIAAMIADKLSKTKGAKYEVRKITTGYQVVMVTQCPPHIPPSKPLPVTKSFALKIEHEGTDADCIVIDLKFRGESKVYVDAWTNEGKPISFGKTTLIGWEIMGDMVTLQMAKAVAKKRGLIGSP